MDDPVKIGQMVLDFLDAHPWILITLVAHGAILGAVAYMILLERKVASWVQDRLGPNRVGLGFGIIPWLKDKHMMGLGQPLADGVKFILKEDYAPKNVDKVLFSAAPMMMIVVVILSIAVLPWGGIKQTTRDIDLSSWIAGERPADATENLDAKIKAYLPNDANTVTHEEYVKDLKDSDGVWRQHLLTHVSYRYNFQTATLNIGVLFILAALSLAVYGVVIGGWASNNKYSFLGGLRATANMISYEIPLGLAVLAVVLLYGTLNLEEIVNKQAHAWFWFIPAWNIWSQPLAFIMFLVCIHAEANRAPFDMAEAEQELVGGYHTEYSAMRFALFFLGEYAGMVTTSVVCVALFFGGWQFPGVDWLTVHVINALTHAGAWVDPTDPAVTNSLVLCIVRAVVFFVKTLVIIFIFMWVRWSLPRFRFDQVMGLAWRGLIPISLALLLTTAVYVFYFGGVAEPDQWLRGAAPLWLLLANVILTAIIMIASKLLPAAPDTNRKIAIPGSRFKHTPLPAGSATPSVN
ncbi:MAG TPA: complex I subunit 1 family protein [Tepidisphaeraceae bacterium]|jgi:NADH-quinone oxidoreductase subunit H|nr:complex I subunit 1 family protein [Tepidisphaeraceae bacterium]